MHPTWLNGWRIDDKHTQTGWTTASYRWHLPMGCESSSLHSCASLHQWFDNCVLHLLFSFLTAVMCAKWVEYRDDKNAVCSLIFTECVKAFLSRPWSPRSPRSIAAVGNSNCVAAPVEIISLSAACLFPRCQLMPTVVYLQSHSHSADSKCSSHYFMWFWF